EDPDRAQQLEQIYNRKFNALVAPDYSSIGQDLELPGLAESRIPYSYQRSAVARVVNEPAVLLDHVVGAGKTGTMVMSAMELEDPDRAQQLEQIYNRKFNALVAPDYSSIGQDLELPGLAESRIPYSYQRSAVARVVNEPAVLLDHVVGAGKTGTMVMSAMEL